MSGPVTLITGTRKGIGRHLAEHYCARGHTVYGCSRGEPEWGHANYRHFAADVVDEPAVKKIFSAIADEMPLPLSLMLMKTRPSAT